MVIIMPHPSAGIAALLFFAEAYECWIRFALQVSISSQLLITQCDYSSPSCYFECHIMHSSELHWPQFDNVGMHCAQWALCK